METKDYLDYLVRVIHTAIVATVDEEGLPVTAAIDMMDTDGDSLYFMTAKGKSLYDRLKKRPFLALTGLWGDNTMTRKALSIRGKVRELGEEKRSDLFRKNRYMWEIYPTEISQKALSVFQIYEGRGEWFDLSKKPVERDSFTFGGGKRRKTVIYYRPMRGMREMRGCLSAALHLHRKDSLPHCPGALPPLWKLPGPLSGRGCRKKVFPWMKRRNRKNGLISWWNSSKRTPGNTETFRRRRTGKGNGPCSVP